jgi:hypothetical protein
MANSFFAVSRGLGSESAGGDDEDARTNDFNAAHYPVFGHRDKSRNRLHVGRVALALPVISSRALAEPVAPWRQVVFWN